MPNNHVIDCVCSVAEASLDVLCRHGEVHVTCMWVGGGGVILLARSVVRPWGQLRACFFFSNTIRYIFPVKLAANLTGNDTVKIQIFITNRHYLSWDRPDRTGVGNPTNSTLYLHELQMDGT